MIVLALVSLALALLPALLFWVNLRLYRPAPAPLTGVGISLLIPARNEELSIGAAVACALASQDVDLEVIVLDDHSDDNTAQIVAALSSADPRVHLCHAPPLPVHWCGKQHACWILSQQATKPLLVFVDADVRLAPDALARMAAFQQQTGAALISGVPHQETGSWLERLVLPLIHFVLLGFLPLNRMRASAHPAYASGCGQLFLSTRSGYDHTGGHAAIRSSLHDGITLPRNYRVHGLHTDLFDATDLANCRMYHSAGQVWFGLAKNATEGLARPGLIVPATLLLLGGQVLPFVLAATLWNVPVAWGVALLASATAYAPRILAAVRFRQSYLGALLHPFGILVLLAIQWYALGRALLGRPSAWKGRSYAPESS